MSIEQMIIMFLILDGPVAGLLYFIWKSMNIQERIWKK